MRTVGVFDPVLDLNPPTQLVDDTLKQNPTLMKAALLVNHLFRMAIMAAFMVVLPFSSTVNMAIGLGGSLFYRITAERVCPYRFAIPSCLGASAYHLSARSLALLVSGVALQSMKVLAITLAGTLPIALWTIGILAWVDESVEARRLKSSWQWPTWPSSSTPSCCKS